MTPHIAINGTPSKLGKPRKTAIGKRTTRHPGYAASGRKRICIEEIFGWTKFQTDFSKVKLRGRQKVQALFTMATCAYNLIRIPKILAQAA